MALQSSLCVSATAAVGAFLLIRTIVAPPVVIVGRTTDDLKAFLCKTDWWDHTFTSSEYI